MEDDKKDSMKGRTWPDLASELSIGFPVWLIGCSLAAFVVIWSYAGLFMEGCRKLPLMGEAGNCNTVEGDLVSKVHNALINDPNFRSGLKGESGDDGLPGQNPEPAQVIEVLLREFQSELRSAVGNPTDANMLPEGAILAFDNSQNCPEGWNALTQHAGHIVRVAGDQENLHSFLPRHSHEIYTTPEERNVQNAEKFLFDDEIHEELGDVRNHVAFVNEQIPPADRELYKLFAAARADDSTIVAEPPSVSFVFCMRSDN